jgi:bacterioferritin-associated ferredoxin
MDEQSPNSGPDQASIGCMSKPSEPTRHVPWAPPGHPIYRGLPAPQSHTSHSFAKVLSRRYQPGAATAAGFHHRSSTTPTHHQYWVGSPNSYAAHHKSYAEQNYWWPSSLDPPGAAPLSLGRTLHHESPNPSGDPISIPEADIVHGRAGITGRASSGAGSALRSPPPRRTSLLGGPPPHDAQPCGLHPRRALHPDGSPSWAETPDSDVDPPLLPRPTMSAVANGDPSPTAQIPHVLGVVTDCLECYYCARVWLRDRLSGVVTDCL